MYKTQYIVKYLPELKKPASEKFSADNGYFLNVCIRDPTVSYWGKSGVHRPQGFCSLGSVAAKNTLKISEESNKEHTYITE